VSKHQAANEQPQASDISAIREPSKPGTAAPTDTPPLDGEPAASAFRHGVADNHVADDQAADDQAADDQAADDRGAGEPGGDAVTEDRPGVADETDASIDDAPAAATPSRSNWRKPLLVAAAALVCLATVGGGTVTAMSKDVSVVVDGQVRQVSTMSSSVAGALSAAGISPGSHDSVAPGVDASISDGSKIVINRGRLLTLTVDGQQRKVWTTARTVDEALAELGQTRSDLSLSANRSRPIPVDGLAVKAATLHTVSMSLGGAAKAPSTTTAKTVGALLAEKKVKLGAHDTVKPALSTKLTNGLVVKVNRVVVGTATRTVALAQPASKSVDDPALQTGTTKVVQKGKPGAERITYRVTKVNGKQVGKTETGRRVAVAPVATITHVGTRTTFTYVGNEVFTNDTTFGVNWDGLANCESTHNPKAVNANPSAGLPTYGLFQFDIPTWATVGGSGNPMDASPQEQLMRAKLLYQQRGLEPWACRDAAH